MGRHLLTLNESGHSFILTQKGCLLPHDPEGLPARERNCRAVKHSNDLRIIPIFAGVGQKVGAKLSHENWLRQSINIRPEY